jgi:hypothetical protein
MRQKSILPIIAVAAACVVAPVSRAQLQGPEPNFEKSDRVWITCLRDARKQFPDYTTEDNAKRERAFKRCLEASNLPYGPSTPKESAGSSRR